MGRSGCSGAALGGGDANSAECARDPAIKPEVNILTALMTHCISAHLLARSNTGVEVQICLEEVA